MYNRSWDCIHCQRKYSLYRHFGWRPLRHMSQSREPNKCFVVLVHLHSQIQTNTTIESHVQQQLQVHSETKKSCHTQHVAAQLSIHVAVPPVSWRTTLTAETGGQSALSICPSCWNFLLKRFSLRLRPFSSRATQT